MIEHRWTEQLSFYVALRDNNSDKGMWEEAFERGLHVPPYEMPIPKIVLDLGSNIGLTAAHYATMWRDALVWMVEPHPENMALARRNAPSCPPLQCAVAKHSGWRCLRELDRTASAYELAKNGLGVYAIGMEELLECVGGHADFVKMDVEGAEWEILQLQPLAISHLLVEFHGEEPYEDLLESGLELLEQTGWNARHHPPHPAAVYATR